DVASDSKLPLIEAADLSGKLVLVVEDSKLLQKLLIKQLHNLGIRAHSVFNGLEAVEAIRGLDFDLVLMDCQLPEMDGFDATRNIRKMEAALGKRTPIIALTAGAMRGDRERCLEAGMDDYLSKPVTVRQLAEKLTQWISLKESKQS